MCRMSLEQVEGRLAWSPFHQGPVERETRSISAPLRAICSIGYPTVSSDPGLGRRRSRLQRCCNIVAATAFVAFLAPAEEAASIAEFADSARLIVSSTPVERVELDGFPRPIVDLLHDWHLVHVAATGQAASEFWPNVVSMLITTRRLHS